MSETALEFEQFLSELGHQALIKGDTLVYSAIKLYRKNPTSPEQFYQSLIALQVKSTNTYKKLLVEYASKTLSGPIYI